MPRPIKIPNLVSLVPKPALTAARRASMLDLVRVPDTALQDKVLKLEQLVGPMLAEAVGEAIPALMEGPIEAELYDAFFLVTRTEGDSEAVGLMAVLQAMRGYVELLQQSSNVSVLEAAIFLEAVLAIIENYGGDQE